MVSKFVDSLKRLFIEGKITKKYIESLVESDKITTEDQTYIVEE